MQHDCEEMGGDYLLLEPWSEASLSCKLVSVIAPVFKRRTPQANVTAYFLSCTSHLQPLSLISNLELYDSLTSIVNYDFFIFIFNKIIIFKYSIVHLKHNYRNKHR